MYNKTWRITTLKPWGQPLVNWGPSPLCSDPVFSNTTERERERERDERGNLRPWGDGPILRNRNGRENRLEEREKKIERFQREQGSAREREREREREEWKRQISQWVLFRFTKLGLLFKKLKKFTTKYIKNSIN